MERMLVILSCIIFVAVQLCEGYPSGPPVEQYPLLCNTLAPQHGFNPMTTDVPYTVEIGSDGCYRENIDLTLTVSVASGQSQVDYFRGLFLQANVGVDGNLYGTFSVDDDKLKTLHCHSGLNNAVGHNNTFGTIRDHTSLSFVWRAPSGLRSDVYFRYTIVHKTDEFWVNETTTALVYNENCIPTSVSSCVLPSWTALIICAVLFINKRLL